MICFNSRTHAGCDQKGNNSVAPNPMFQFTHPRGVRRKPLPAYECEERFNSRTHAGCDTQLYPFVVQWCLCFNSRTHAGCDGAQPAAKVAR